MRLMLMVKNQPEMRVTDKDKKEMRRRMLEMLEET